ncbi:Tetrahydrofolate dehydrogenase/cyclohydrolase [Bartonella apihabitans]|uniref:Bifunctional protein FolD n=1 Tax=Bartonella apihabitans TaxID=2750929 RepID=A0A1U9MDS2_9HYPH|nr:MULTISPECIES: bifunctional methylenetetrahydrofolate dehydrogenase/methenyltetrahydrofolate cyclohydrolase FolD [Bartonella]AQT43416.1 methylenetetrahydrofolate dehydrogenase (NADP+) / methenyltetrahydrofolate cyclohydrolase [Bartonella apihabitans]MBH9995837.1 bifunctional methylenetetrahydrofolate dehydrogenase/methenyltetrahydrofolate cyclohydrolase FolD [Bartonella sp. P0291]MBH9997998.1 bifunctional methylenetetrahydrofolate dehydrogenase/methenyltetrahydrofolate cyclohydrolase FolD [Bar
MANVIDGKKLSEDILAKVKQETAVLREQHNIQPGIAVIIVGEDSASKVYVASKEKRAEECGFLSNKYELDEKTSESDLLALVKELNEDKNIHGILVQLPLPAHINADHVIQTISPDKDVDGFHYINAGKLMTGAIEDAFIPCTPAGIMFMINHGLGKDLSGLDAVVVGRSNIVGKPVAALLLAANATVTIAHSRTREIDDVCRSADILVAAVGKPEMIKGDWIKPGATVIDVGINRIPAPERGQGKTRLVGDVEYQTAEKVAGFITPVPGGVGPMTIAMLMANTLKAACKANNLPLPKF